MHQPECEHVTLHKYEGTHHRQHNDRSDRFSAGEDGVIVAITQLPPHIRHVIVADIPQDRQKNIREGYQQNARTEGFHKGLPVSRLHGDPSCPGLLIGCIRWRDLLHQQ